MTDPDVDIYLRRALMCCAIVACLLIGIAANHFASLCDKVAAWVP